MVNYADPETPDWGREADIIRYIKTKGPVKPWTLVTNLCDVDKAEYRAALKSLLLRDEMRIHADGTVRLSLESLVRNVHATTYDN